MRSIEQSAGFTHWWRGQICDFLQPTSCLYQKIWCSFQNCLIFMISLCFLAPAVITVNTTVIRKYWFCVFFCTWSSKRFLFSSSSVFLLWKTDLDSFSEDDHLYFALQCDRNPPEIIKFCVITGDGWSFACFKIIRCGCDVICGPLSDDGAVKSWD